MAASSSSSSSSSSQVFGGAEECQSCESGWTFYISSPTKEMVQYDEHDDIGNEEDHIKIYGRKQDKYKDRKLGKDKDDMDSDDSMASDASSGPVDLAGGDQSWRQHEGDSDGEEMMQSDERKMKGVLAERAGKNQANTTRKQTEKRKK